MTPFPEPYSRLHLLRELVEADGYVIDADAVADAVLRAQREPVVAVRDLSGSRARIRSAAGPRAADRPR